MARKDRRRNGKKRQKKKWHTDFNDEKLICTDTKYLGMERGFTLIERINTDFKY